MTVNENTNFRGNIWRLLGMIFAIASSVRSFAFSYIGYNYRIEYLEIKSEKQDEKIGGIEKAIIDIATVKNDISWMKLDFSGVKEDLSEIKKKLGN